MNREIFARRLVLPALAGLFALAAGCGHPRDVPVRNSNPRVSPKTPARPLPPPVSAASPGTVHVVRQGETLYAVSRLYSIPVKDLIAWNNLARPEALDVGQTLRIVPPGAAAAPARAETLPVAPQSAFAEPVPPPQSTSVDVAPLPDIKREPRGGKEAYSDEAWARLQPQTPGAAPTGVMPAAPGPVPPADAAPPRPGTDAAAPQGGWMWPVKGTIIGRFDENTGGNAKPRSRGIDISAAPGTPVLAAAGGKVAYAGSALRGLGNLVIIKHNDEYLTAYAHNRVILVKEGDTVARGQKIAELGSSDADQPKLHFELRKRGQPVDPLKYLPGL